MLQQARRNARRGRNRGAIGKCHLSRRVRKLRQFVLKTMKTFRKNWFEKALRKPTTISV